MIRPAPRGLVIRRGRSNRRNGTSCRTANAGGISGMPRTDAAVLYGRSFTLLTTQAAARLTPGGAECFSTNRLIVEAESKRGVLRARQRAD